jgi:hypothetical protein
MFLNVLNDAKLVKISNGAAAGQTPVTSNTLDTAGYNSVLLVADLATVVSGAVIQLTAQDGVQANGSDAANITATTGPFAAAGATVQTPALTDSGGATSNKLVALDVIKPQKRYVTAVLTRTTQNVTVNSLWALLYNADVKPLASQDPSVAASATFNCGT